MKKLMAVIVMLLTIASGAYSQSSDDSTLVSVIYAKLVNPKDTVCIQRADAIKKLRQADSLELAKLHIITLSDVVFSQRQSLYVRDSTIAELKIRVEAEKDIAGSYRRENNENKDKFLKADTRGKQLDIDLRRQKTKTLVTGGFGIVATIITFLIASH
jgi:hypothetical protein